jgi:predicted ArsR family transcriptional regulator
MESITIEQHNTKRGAAWLTYEQAAEYAGISEAVLRAARHAQTLLPDGNLQTGERGRPALLFRKATINDFAKRYRAAKKAAAQG